MDRYSGLEVSRLIASILLVSASIFVQINSTSVNESIKKGVVNEEPAESEIVGLMDQENWPILRAEFPSSDFPNSKLQQLFEGEFSAHEYIDQISGGSSALNVSIVDGVWQSPFEDSYWGADSIDERDVGEGSGGATEMASLAISSLLNGHDLSNWDLDGDNVVDRLLILHSGQPQELGGTSGRIWSHFSPLEEPIIIGGYEIQHYTMASIYGGIGVLLHEMMHQMGAVDLYDVHSDSPTKSWHGLGDWDIMSSGNWIGDGSTPSLPSSSTLNLIGALDPIVIENMEDSTFSLEPISQGGSPLKIDIGFGEYIWVTLRSDVGFDSGLPGHGILVEQQDENFGDIQSNLVNTDPTKPWSKIVEADGNDALLRGRDYGSSSDVFSDGDSFGNTGHMIWDNTGRLVPWAIQVVSMNVSSATVHFEYFGDNSTTIITPRNPIVLLPGEESFAEVIIDESCDFVVNISSMNGVIVENFVDPQSRLKILNATEQLSRKGTLSGEIGCSGRAMTNVSLEWQIVNHKLSDNVLESTIPWDQDSVVSFYPDSLGNGPRSYSITVDGPASRISSPITTGQYFPGEPIDILIEPNGLLEPRMIARGELVLIDSYNIEQRIPIVLTAEEDLPFGPLNWLAEPSNAITAVLLLLAFSISSSKRK